MYIDNKQQQQYEGIHEASKDITIFRIIAPQAPYKLRCRNLFGVQQFAEEAQSALEEKLITYQDFAYIRNLFHQALKIRAEFDAGHFNQQQFYSHAVTLFAEIIDSEDENGTIHADNNKKVLKIGHATLDETTYVLQGYYEYCSSKGIQSKGRGCKRAGKTTTTTTQSVLEQQQQQSIYNTVDTDETDRLSVNCGQESHYQEESSLPPTPRLRRAEHYQFETIQQQQQDIQRQQQQRVNSGSVYDEELEGKHSSTLDKVDTIVVDKDCDNFQKVVLRKRFSSTREFEKDNGDDSFIDEGIGENTEQYAYALHAQQSMESYKERGQNHSPYRQRSYLDMDDTTSRRSDRSVSPLPRSFKWGVDTDYVCLTNRHLSSTASTPRGTFSYHESFIKNQSQRSPENELLLQKLKQECGHRIDDINFFSHLRSIKKYTDNADNNNNNNNNNFEGDSDSASNPSDTLSPAPSFITCKEDSCAGSKSDVESRWYADKKEESQQYRRSLSPSPLFLREQMKSPTLSEQSFSTQFSVSSLPRKPRVWRNQGGKRRLDSAHRSTSINECVLTEEAYDLFEDMCTCGTYKWLIFQLNTDNQQIEVTDAGDNTTTYKQLLATLSPNKCSYAVYNQGPNNKQRSGPLKMIFINWRPEESPRKQRMTYAQNKDFLKSCLGSISLEVQATEIGDLDEKYVLQQVR